MTARLKPRELGCVLSYDGCDAVINTAVILVGPNRTYARTLGWGRGLRKSTAKQAANGRHDYCPKCMVAERKHADEVKKARAERIAARDVKRKALDAKIRDGYAKRDAAVAAEQAG